MKAKIWLLAAMAIGAGTVQAAPGGSPEDLKAAVHKMSQLENYTWTVSTSNEGETEERYSVGPLDGRTEKGGLTWIRTRQTTPIEIVYKGPKMAVRLDEGWATEQDLASGTRLRQHANLSVVRSLKTHPRPTVQATQLLKYMKDAKEGNPGYFVSDLDDAAVKDLLRQSLRTARNPDVASKGGVLAFWVQDGVVIKYEMQLRGTVTYPPPAASSWSADLRITVGLSSQGTTVLDVPEDVRKKVE